MSDKYKSGRQSTPVDRMYSNPMERVKSSLQQSTERVDLSKQAQDYLDQQAGKRVLPKGN